MCLPEEEERNWGSFVLFVITISVKEKEALLLHFAVCSHVTLSVYDASSIMLPTIIIPFAMP